MDIRKLEPYMLSILRILSGLLIGEHGLQKLIGWPPGPETHVMPITSFIGFGGLLEAVGGVLLVLGLFTRPAAFILSGEMAIAYFMAHASKGFYPAVNGGDAAVLFCFIFLFLFFAGPGPLSLDVTVLSKKGNSSPT